MLISGKSLRVYAGAMHENSHKASHQALIEQRSQRRSTRAEQLLWLHLRKPRFSRTNFRRHFPIGPYVVGFVCLTKKLIVELDSGWSIDDQSEDIHRGRYLNLLGFRVARYKSNEVLNRIESVLEDISLKLI